MFSNFLIYPSCHFRFAFVCADHRSTLRTQIEKNITNMITIEMKFYDFSPNSRNVCVLCDYVFFNGISCLVVELLEIPRLPTILAIFVAFVI